MRNDVIIDKKQVICRNSSLLGYSTCKVRFGMIVRYKNGEFDNMIGRVAGRIAYAPALGETPVIRNWILVMALGPNLTYAMERWVNPDDVIEAYDPSRPDTDILEFITEFFSPSWHQHKPQEFRQWCEYGSRTMAAFKQTEWYKRNNP